MKRHRLLLFQQMSNRLRNTLTLLLLCVFAVGLYDQFYPVLGDLWYFWWGLIVVVFLLWVYYARLVPRASLQVRPKYMRLQGPLRGFNISYGRIHSVTSATVFQHFPPDTLTKDERRLVESMRGKTCVFIELVSLPKSLTRRRWWMPRLLFGTSRTGLLLAVDDWIALSHDVEAGRAAWRLAREKRNQPDRRSLATRVLEA